MFTPLKGRSQGNSMDEHGDPHAALPAPDAPPGGLAMQSSIPKRVCPLLHLVVASNCTKLCCVLWKFGWFDTTGSHVHRMHYLQACLQLLPMPITQACMLYALHLHDSAGASPLNCTGQQAPSCSTIRRTPAVTADPNMLTWVTGYIHTPYPTVLRSLSDNLSSRYCLWDALPSWVYCVSRVG